MQKRKFDELISHFNRKVSDMSIDQKYKMELLGMISAIGFAHEEELGTNLAEVGTDCISRQQAIDALKRKQDDGKGDLSRFYNTIIQHDIEAIMQLPPIQPEIVRCGECKWFQCNMRQDGYLPKGVDEFECRHWCGYCDPTDFCSYAERRTGWMT